MTTDCLIVFRKKSDRNLKNYLMAASVIDSLREELYPEVIGIVNQKVDCYLTYDEAVVQYNKNYEAYIQRNHPDFDTSRSYIPCTLRKGDMMLLVAGKDYFMENAIFDDTVLKGKVMVVYPGIGGADWYDCNNVFVINEDKKWSDCFVCCKSYSNPDKDKLPLNPLLTRITK